MQSKRILVVEDNEVNLKSLESTLKKAGYEVVCTQSGEDALKIVENLIPDMVLLDINLPGMNGTEVGEALRNNPKTRDIPLCYITGLLDKEEEEKLENKLLGNFFFAKPYNTAKLLEEIEKRI